MKTAYLKYIVSVILFGSNGIIAAYIALNSFEIVLARALIGSLFLVGVFLLSRKRLTFFHSGKQALFLIVSGVAMGASWMFLYEAYSQVGVSVATLLYYSGPIFVMVCASLIFKEKVKLSKILGFVAVVSGMLCVNGFGFGAAISSWGLICGVLAALTYAVMVIFNKKASTITGIENAMWQLVFGCITVALFTFFNHSGPVIVPVDSVLPIVVLGLLNTGFGCYLYFSSLHSLPAQTVSICGYLEPLSALAFSAVCLGERLLPLQLVGAALILGGAAFAELYRKKKLDDPKA